MKLYRCRELLELPVLGMDGRKKPGECCPVAAGTVWLGEDEVEASEGPVRLECLWGGQPIRVSRKTLGKYFDELA